MKYIPTIGLEMHCEVKTNSKNFSSAANVYDDTPNTNIKPVDMAFPGSLPVVNKEAVRKSIIMALCLNCEIPDVLMFERKNYYYPDLPKGYQITQQNHKPIGIKGKLIVEVNEENVEITIDNIHLEEDTASLDHYFDCSLIDYNRAGVPLLECVTTPCIHSAEVAVAFLETMRNIYQYTDVSEADTKRGQVRCDVNVSLALEGSKELGTKVEVKNINSFGAVHDAIIYEIKRQTELLENGKGDEIEQETRRWDDESQTTISMRSKVDAIDYKYFVEPNIPKIKLDRIWIQEIEESIPMLPLQRKALYIKEYALSAYDANVIIKDKGLADFFEECINLEIEAKTAANWVTVQILGELNKDNLSINDLFITPVRLKYILHEMNKGTISSKQAKEVFYKVINEKMEPTNFISVENAQISDENTLTLLIDKIMESNFEQVNQYRAGKTNLFDFFVGQVMKETRGKANPVLTKELLNKKL